MSTRKQRRKAERDEAPDAAEQAAPAPHRKAAPAPPPAAPENPAEERRAQRVMAMVGFALTGLLMGFLAGANQPISVPPSTSALVQAFRIGAAVAVDSADWWHGVGFGVMGLLMGGTFGFSLFLSPSLMFLSWFGGAIGMAAGLATHVIPLAGIGWAAGFVAVLMGAARSRLAQS